MREDAEKVISLREFKSRRNRKRDVRATTISSKRTTKRELVHLKLLNQQDATLLTEGRPMTRGDCIGGCRPCPLVACKYNLYLDINEKTGAVKLNFPDLEPEEMPHSCALDIADQGGTTLEDVGELTNITRERVRQIETIALVHVKRLMRKRQLVDETDMGRAANVRVDAGGSLLHPREPDPVEEPDEFEVPEEDAVHGSLWNIDHKTGFFPKGSLAVACGRAFAAYERSRKDNGDRGETEWDFLEPYEVEGREETMTKEEYEAQAKEREQMRMSEEQWNKRRGEVLQAIRVLTDKNGSAPTMGEIGHEIGLKSPTESALKQAILGTLGKMRDAVEWDRNGVRIKAGIVGKAGDDVPTPSRLKVASSGSPIFGGASVEVKVGRKVKSSDPVVVALEERRASLMAKVNALNDAITVLREA